MIDEEKLIEMVKNYEVLYDKNCGNYKNAVAKKVAWADIGAMFGVSAELCSKKWTTLRERFARELRKENEPSGSAASTSYGGWPLMEAMDFLRVHLKPRPTRCIKHIMNVEYEFYSAAMTEFMPSLSSTLESSALSTRESNPLSIQASESELMAAQSVSSQRKRRHNCNNVETKQMTAIDDKHDMCKNQNNNGKIKGFQLFLGSTLNAMSEEEQDIAIAGITNLILEVKRRRQ